MTNKKLFLSFISIVLLAVLVGFYSYPKPLNDLIGVVNKQFNWTISELKTNEYKLGLDLRGGVHLEYKADLSSVPDKEKVQVMEGLRDVIERRINIFGVAEPIIQIYGQDRIAVELPGVSSIEDAIKWIGQTPLLEFYEQKTDDEMKKMEDIAKKVQEVLDANKDKDQETIFAEVQKIPDWQLAYDSPFKKTELTGRYLQKASVDYNQMTYAPEINLQFNDEGAKIFEKITERNVGKSIAIFLDGQSIVDTTGDGKIDGADLYAPRVEQKISGGKAVISGGKETLADAKVLVQRLNQGALPVPLGQPIVQQKIGPTLGAISLNNAVQAGVVGFILIVSFLIIFYRLPGLVASFALIVYVILLMGLLKLVSVTLTLAGIGGLILSIGIAVDANILIFSRLREELKAGKDVSTAIKEGAHRAWPSIRDGHFATIVVALILYIFGTSFIKAFSFALILGILISLFSAVTVSNIFLTVVAKNKWIAKTKIFWS